MDKNSWFNNLPLGAWVTRICDRCFAHVRSDDEAAWGRHFNGKCYERCPYRFNPGRRGYFTCVRVLGHSGFHKSREGDTDNQSDWYKVELSEQPTDREPEPVMPGDEYPYATEFQSAIAKKARQDPGVFDRQCKFSHVGIFKAGLEAGHNIPTAPVVMPGDCACQSWDWSKMDGSMNHHPACDGFGKLKSDARLDWGSRQPPAPPASNVTCPECGHTYDSNQYSHDAAFCSPASEGAKAVTGCQDCNRPYGEPGFPDFIIPYSAWKQISPTGDDGGLLCPSCIVARLERKGIKCEGAFMSGPIESVSQTTMNNLRRVENIELAIDGRDNRWSGIREMVQTEPLPAKPDIAAELSLLVIDFNSEQCVVKIEVGETPMYFGGENYGRIKAGTKHDIVCPRYQFEQVKAAIDALADGEKPVPRIERIGPNSFRFHPYGALHDDKSFFWTNTDLDRLNELAGHPLPIWTPKTGEWQKLFPFEIPNAPSDYWVRLESDAIPVEIWRYVLSNGGGEDAR